jgi:CHAT domain-containing protein
MGRRLYAALFGALTAREVAHPAWLLSLDDALFQLPFAALVTEVRSGKMKYLVEQHSLQVVPGALSLIGNLTGASRGFRGVADGQTGHKSEADWFLGLGDPIYNTADPRWGAVHPARERFKGWFAYGAADNGIGQLSRLVGSASEVESSARNWTAGVGTASLLMGGEAQRERFLALIARQPAIIHLATHVLTPETTWGTPWPNAARVNPSEKHIPSDANVEGSIGFGSTGAGTNRRRDPLIAFGLAPSGRPEVLSTSEIGMLDVPGAVVSMTGCDSGEGDIQAGAGLLGLARAWQIAGARAVIATGWPVNDTEGELFAAFYRYLRSGSPAEALRRSQVQMIHSGTWRSSPAYWASYQVTGGAQ